MSCDSGCPNDYLHIFFYKKDKKYEKGYGYEKGHGIMNKRILLL